MPHAVIQTDNVAITPEQLGQAIAVTQRYTRADGLKMAREPYGLIVDKLEHDEAVALQRALAREGINAAVIDETELFDLPPIKVPKRIDCLPEHLLVHDVLGRQREMDWEQVLVVAAGFVNIYEATVVEETRREPRGMGAIIAGTATAGLIGGRTAKVTHRSLHGSETARLVLELIVEGEPARYRAEAEGLLYNYLGERQTGDVAGNFFLLTQDLMQHATAAVMNQGAVALAMNGADAFVYDTRHSFEREIVWLIWWGSREE